MADVRGDGSGVAQWRARLDAGVALRVREQARRLGVSAATVFHVVWSRVLSVVSGQDDVVFGTVVLGRMQAGEGADRVPGLFMNTLPVRAGTGAGVAGAVRAMQGQLAELMVHEHASLGTAQRMSGVQAPAPLFTTLFNYRHAPGATAGGQGTGPDGVRLLRAQDRTNYPVTVSVDDFGADSGFGLDVQTVTPIDPRAV
ncbi:condensation domain-containing protein, partial [Streptomyces fuscichromogenes]|uniref:condensation domain-containing protein n=1 Tax=Streptomyces fuscichromogenes TaxID=1324013 RepID=UPI0016715A00